ncbi:MAG TPA: DinB family protein [Acidimicrobiales bacterium]|nr:DinB family protein [Acidimicrobiales bacterium]
MSGAAVLSDAFGRIHEAFHGVTAGLDPAALEYQPDPESNSIAWLLWHLTRVQDDHVAAAFGSEQIWTSQGWHLRFALPFEPEANGYGMEPKDVAAVRVDSPALLTDYHDAVYAQTARFLERLADAELDRIVDERWDPPVTLGVRLVSVVEDDLQHVGQAAYLRGVFERR